MTLPLDTILPPVRGDRQDWWTDAVVYQVYLRSFRDADGDGIGDLRGLVHGLPEIAALGCDALWLNPCYASPQRDHGYDISDYRSIDPAYGTLDDFTELVSRAHDLGVRVIMDMVANHCSSEHPWFLAALAAAPGSRERARFLFRDGRGEAGELPPNNWQSVFGGAAWTRVVEADGTPGQWYLHSFDPGQPDFDWRNPEVADEFDDVLTFWFDRGVDGFRIDVAHGHVKAEGLPDWPGADDGTGGHNAAMWDQPEVHEMYRRWRGLGERYPQPRYLVGEVWVPGAEALAAYLRPDELHQAFTFELLVQPWDAGRIRAAIETGLAMSGGGAPAWTLSNHDVHRAATRYGQEQSLAPADPTDMIAAARRRGPVDAELGVRRALAAAALMLALPGAAYLYQGEELGLPEVFDLPDDARQDPIWIRSGGAELGRDGCRVPLPWSSDGATLGFGPPQGAAAWLPQPAWFSAYARDLQGAPGTPLATYRSMLTARRELFRAGEPLRWLDPASSDVLAFLRGAALCVVNLGAEPFPVPAGWRATDRVLTTLTVGADDELVVAPDSASWFRARPHDPIDPNDRPTR